VTLSSFVDPLHPVVLYGMFSGTIWLGGMTSSQVVATGWHDEAEKLPASSIWSVALA
jgi:hypothetical protein